MGYRSDVAYAIHFPDQASLIGFAASIRLGGDEYELGALKECCVTPFNGAVYLTLWGEGWKWYQSYPEVMAHERIMEKAYEAGHSYRFIRIGEGDTDTEFNQQDASDDAEFWKLLNINRSVSHSFSDTTLSSILTPNEKPTTEDSNG